MRRGVGANRVTLKHIQTVRKANGKVHRYLRIPGKKRTRLPDLPLDHPEFLSAYLALVGTTEPDSAPATGTVAALVTAFLRSEQFLSLSKGYRPTIRRNADAIRTRGVKAMAAHLKPDHIKADCAPLAPHAARSRLKTWRLICKFGEDTGLLKVDVSEGVKAKKVPATDGHKPWTVDDIAAFRAHWPIDSVQRRAFELLFWTGARTVDAVTLGRGKVGKDGVLSYVQSKTGAPAYVPWTCALPVFADPQDHVQLMAALAHAPAQMTYLSTRQGRGRTEKGLSNLISDAAKAVIDAEGQALIVGKSAHGLRKARVIDLVERGATTSQGMAWVGHLTPGEFEHYGKARNRRAAVMGTEQGRKTVNGAQTGT